jgi:hypothetical protein
VVRRLPGALILDFGLPILDYAQAIRNGTSRYQSKIGNPKSKIQNRHAASHAPHPRAMGLP